MKRYLAIALAALLLCIALTAFVGCKEDEDVIRLNEVTHSLFYAPQYLAMALGYFEEEGLTVEITNGSGADNVMTALLTGEADIGLMGCEATIYVYLQGKKDYPRIIGQLTKRDGSFLVARTDMPNFDYGGIEGSSVLMGRKGGMPAMILQYVLNNKGYRDGENITMDYSIQFGALGPAFTGGTGDFVPLFEPAASQLVQEGKGYIVSAIGMDSGEIPYTCYTATAEFLQNNGDKAVQIRMDLQNTSNEVVSTDIKGTSVWKNNGEMYFKVEAGSTETITITYSEALKGMVIFIDSTIADAPEGTTYSGNITFKDFKFKP